mmetsp:Transcript_12518/g.35166  ORF Transcript_12518/g.35166 Transcript_12518/m.35166 type:complete len:227 (-) Transcript_12518:345-1025(-)
MCGLTAPMPPAWTCRREPPLALLATCLTTSTSRVPQPTRARWAPGTCWSPAWTAPWRCWTAPWRCSPSSTSRRCWALPARTPMTPSSSIAETWCCAAGRPATSPTGSACLPRRCSSCQKGNHHPARLASPVTELARDSGAPPPYTQRGGAGAKERQGGREPYILHNGERAHQEHQTSPKGVLPREGGGERRRRRRRTSKPNKGRWGQEGSRHAAGRMERKKGGNEF